MGLSVRARVAGQICAVVCVVIVSLSSVWSETAEFKITDDPELDAIVTEVRKKFLDMRVQNQPEFNKLDVTVLIPEKDGTWRRGSYGPDTLHYPASTVKLSYMAAAAQWEQLNGKPVGYLEPDVGPMMRVSDNVATGRVVDAITSTTNWNSEPGAPPYEQWKAARMYTMDYLAARGLLENQVAHVKTYPSNSGSGPAGYEERMWKELGKNQLQTRASASLLLEIVKGKLEPRSTDYMRKLLTHDRWGGDSVLGFGVPPGAIYENKYGCAYDTLADFAYIKMPGNDKEMILAVLSNAFINSEKSQPRPYNLSVLGPFAEMMIERLGLDAGAPPKIKRDNSDTRYFSATGVWGKTSEASEKWGKDYLLSKSDGDGPGADSATSHSATWKLSVPKAGRWEVCVWYPQSTVHHAEAWYAIQHDQGESLVQINQQKRGGRWVKLGDFEFAQNTGQVTLSKRGSDSNQPLAADAIKATLWP